MADFKVLIVDDEEDFRKVIGERIRSWGYDVIEAAGGKEGVETVKKEKPDAVVLDYMMPGMDGMATLKQIRRLDKDVAVIMFTAHSEMKLMEGAQKLGVTAFIPKLSAYAETHEALKTAIMMTAKKSKK